MTPTRGYTPSVEELRADLEALATLSTLAILGSVSEDNTFTDEITNTAFAWLKAEIERTENTIDGLEAGLGGVVPEARCDVCNELKPRDEVRLVAPAQAAGTETWACEQCREAERR